MKALISRNESPNASLIYENKYGHKLYLGDWYASIDRAALILHKIKSIICLNDNVKSRADLKMYEELGIKHYYFNISDHPSEDTRMYSFFDKCLEILDNDLKTGNVLVHCTAGISRSATIVLMYLMTKYELTYDEAFEYVKNKRDCVMPNRNFVSALRHYNNEFCIIHNCSYPHKDK